MATFKSLRRLKLSRVDLVPRGANPGAHIALFKQEGDPPENPSDGNPNLQPEVETSPEQEPSMADKTGTPAPEAAEVEKLKAELAKAQAELAERDKAVEKAASEATQAEQEIRKELDTTREELTKIRAEQRRAKFVEEAKGYGFGDPEKVGAILEKADEHFEDEQKAALDTLLKSASKQVTEGALFAQLSKGSDDEGPRTARERMEKMARDLVAKGEAPTIEQAKVAVVKQHPELERELFEEVTA